MSDISLNPSDPSVIGDVIASVTVVDIVDTSTRRAIWSVVELNVQMVEPGIQDSVSKIAIWNYTLRRSGQNHCRVVGIHKRSKLISHSTISSTTTTFNIEIETIHDKRTKRTRTSIVGCLGTEYIPHDIGEIDTSIITTQGIATRTTTNRYENLLALTLTLLDVRFQLEAVGEHLCAISIYAALVAKIGRGVYSVVILIGKTIHERDWDDIDVWVVAV